MARRVKHELKAFSGINVTPLMDLTFLLLIVFMITAPILEYTVDVSPPRMNAEKIDEEQSLLIGLSKQGKILYRNDPVNLEQLRAHLSEISNNRPDITVLIRADQSRPYREVVTLMKTVRGSNLYNIALVTRSEK
ncbi:MAG: biopolymer transporter ExbD [Lentisphaeria bacterium]